MIVFVVRGRFLFFDKTREALLLEMTVGLRGVRLTHVLVVVRGVLCLVVSSYDVGALLSLPLQTLAQTTIKTFQNLLRGKGGTQNSFHKTHTHTHIHPSRQVSDTEMVVQSFIE
jgi:hypothetical protein